MAMGKHYGSFGKGFADALIAMIKMSYMRDYYMSRTAYYKSRAKAYGQPKPGSKAALDAEGRAAAADAAGRPLSGYALHGGAGESGGQPSHPATGSWWTPDRMSHAVDRLEKEAGLSHEGASGLVARWSGIEAGAGPSAYNPAAGGHWGIGQWGRDRGGETVGRGSFDDQLTHAIGELNGPEKAAGDALRRASTPEEGARGASMYERGEDYNASTGNDRFTASTPVQRVMAAVGGGSKPAATTPKTEKTSYGGPDAKTSTGATVHTDDQGRAIDPKTGKPTQAQADTGVQVASTDDTAGLEAYLRLHPEAVQYNKDRAREGDQPPFAPRSPDQGAGAGQVNELSALSSTPPFDPRNPDFPGPQARKPHAPPRRPIAIPPRVQDESSPLTGEPSTRPYPQSTHYDATRLWVIFKGHSFHHGKARPNAQVRHPMWA